MTESPLTPEALATWTDEAVEPVHDPHLWSVLVCSAAIGALLVIRWLSARL